MSFGCWAVEFLVGLRSGFWVGLCSSGFWLGFGSCGPWVFWFGKLLGLVLLESCGVPTLI